MAVNAKPNVLVNTRHFIDVRNTTFMYIGIANETSSNYNDRKENLTWH